MHEMQQYYINGYIQKKFAPDEQLTKLLTVIRDLHEGRVKSGFSLEEKYRYSKDLRPNVLEYDDCFIDILSSNTIPRLLKTITGFDLELLHIQLRISFPGESYMDWHRDNHIYRGNPQGNFPSVHKIIFYPQVNREAHPKIKVIPGSHRRQTDNKLLDYVQTKLYRPATIMSSDSEFLLFNTDMLHAVVPEPHEKGSFRLIYSFAHAFQLGEGEKDAPTVKKYHERVLKDALR